MTAAKALTLCNFFLNVEKITKNQNLAKFAKRQHVKYWQMHLYKIQK